MQVFTEEMINKIKKAVEQKGALTPCNRCGAMNFAVYDRYITLQTQDHLKGLEFSGPFIPAIGVYCNECGNLTTHLESVLMKETVK
ncbi:hypothetical protein NSQ89_12965 [Niallia sp. FSL R7-0648]|uniref:hypothetical protein n=1 Tax=Niallia sp. FSL R7-0648 TaxID=2954521 RepID=UPI0030FBF50A